MNNKSRRWFLKQGTMGIAATTITSQTLFANIGSASDISRPAILGGKALTDLHKWIKWPIWVPETDEPLVLQSLRSGVWSRAKLVEQFESEWAGTLGAKRCLTTVNGTSALMVALNQLKIRGGDEVLVTPYTFIATIQAILSNGALPVFVDIDPLTYQIDPKKLEAKITPQTKAILPVHILGLPADMNSIMAIAKKHNLIVVEDACQAHLAEIKGKKVGTIGNAGCFSFQNSKQLAIGEAGAVVSDDDEFMDRCFSYHNLGLPYGQAPGAISSGGVREGTKVRLTEYQAAIGLAQLKRLDGQTKVRSTNAEYLKNKIKQIPGIVPYKLYDDVTRAAFLLFAFRYKADAFGGLSRTSFMKALQAEGVPCSSGYTPLNKQMFLKETFQTENFKKIYPAAKLDYQKYMDNNQCPENDALCSEAVWITQNLLLGPQSDMDIIFKAIEKTYTNREKLKRELDK